MFPKIQVDNASIFIIKGYLNAFDISTHRLISTTMSNEALKSLRESVKYIFKTLDLTILIINNAKFAVSSDFKIETNPTINMLSIKEYWPSMIERHDDKYVIHIKKISLPLNTKLIDVIGKIVINDY